MIHSSKPRVLLGLLLVPAAVLAAGITPVSVAAQTTGSLPAPGTQALSADIRSDLSLITLSPTRTDKSGTPGYSAATLVALPYSARTWDVTASDVHAIVDVKPLVMRGRTVLHVTVNAADTDPVTITVHHDGAWNSEASRATAPRQASAAMDGVLSATLPSTPSVRAGTTPAAGSYVIIHAPAFTAAVQPLIDWKTRKGLSVVAASTAVTGVSNTEIKAWLQNAYDTWDRPPEYILLVGDVADIPTYSFSGNPSDLPYILLDGDDWLPDAMIGRMPVENETEARTVVNKTVAYERTPYTEGGTDWFTRALMVAGQSGSTTPRYTVEFCGSQLDSIGFDNVLDSVIGPGADPALVSPIPWPGDIAADFVHASIDLGVSFVVYRGWAYGTAGWDPPAYTVIDIPSQENGAMLPVVMSFVCMNGDYSASEACFGEVFLRQGTPTEPENGAIAFIGNGEHWSHTRHNDAMAISFFERIIDDDITDLGTLLNAGKLRFADYFPLEVDAETYGEESVEFYFHIYNLLGDPELNFWKSQPQGITVSHDATLPAGSNRLSVSVTEEGAAVAVSGARVGIVQDGVLLGCAYTDGSGSADITLSNSVTADPVHVTVTGPGLLPYEGTINAATANIFVAVADVAVDDQSGGNDDGSVNPGETLILTPTLANHGTLGSGVCTATLIEIDGPAGLVADEVSIDSIDGGGSMTTTTGWSLSVAGDAEAGAVITCVVDVVRSGDQHDLSAFTLAVHAPGLQATSALPSGADYFAPGATTAFGLALQGEGDLPTSGGSITVSLLTPDGATLDQATTTFGACAAGGTVLTETDLSLTLDDDLAVGTTLGLSAVITTQEGYASEAGVSIVVGDVDTGAPVGPDQYGYYAYDSADLEYPDQRPVYAWQEISTTFGGPGTAIDLSLPDNVNTGILVDLPFPFQYYGEAYSQIRISDNGWISFDTDDFYNFYNWPIPSEHGNDALVAPFWDNLNPELVDVGEVNPNGIDRDGIYHYYDGDAGTFTVEWSRLPHYKPAEVPGLQTFQVVLYDPAVHETTSGDGEILFQYRQVTNNDHLRMYATVGMESPDGTDGLQLSYSLVNTPGMAALQPGLAVKLTTEAPVRVPYTVTSFSAQAVTDGVQLEWRNDDNRPVLGWLLMVVGPDGTTVLTDDPLPATTRTFLAPVPSMREATHYHLTALHPYGAKSAAGVAQLAGTAPTRLALYAARPNPAPGNASIAFSLPRAQTARLRVYDLAGRLVRTLLDGTVASGQDLVVWDGRNMQGEPVAGGIYFYRLETGGQTLTRKMTLVR